LTETDGLLDGVLCFLLQTTSAFLSVRGVPKEWRWSLLIPLSHPRMTLLHPIFASFLVLYAECNLWTEPVSLHADACDVDCIIARSSDCWNLHRLCEHVARRGPKAQSLSHHRDPINLCFCSTRSRPRLKSSRRRALVATIEITVLQRPC